MIMWKCGFHFPALQIILLKITIFVDSILYEYFKVLMDYG